MSDFIRVVKDGQCDENLYQQGYIEEGSGHSKKCIVEYELDSLKEHKEWGLNNSQESYVMVATDGPCNQNLFQYGFLTHSNKNSQTCIATYSIDSFNQVAEEINQYFYPTAAIIPTQHEASITSSMSTDWGYSSLESYLPTQEFIYNWGGVALAGLAMFAYNNYDYKNLSPALPTALVTYGGNTLGGGVLSNIWEQINVHYGEITVEPSPPMSFQSSVPSCPASPLKRPDSAEEPPASPEKIYQAVDNQLSIIEDKRLTDKVMAVKGELLEELEKWKEHQQAQKRELIASNEANEALTKENEALTEANEALNKKLEGLTKQSESKIMDERSSPDNSSFVLAGNIPIRSTVAQSSEEPYNLTNKKIIVQSVLKIPKEDNHVIGDRLSFVPKDNIPVYGTDQSPEEVVVETGPLIPTADSKVFKEIERLMELNTALNTENMNLSEEIKVLSCRVNETGELYIKLQNEKSVFMGSPKKLEETGPIYNKNVIEEKIADLESSLKNVEPNSYDPSKTNIFMLEEEPEGSSTDDESPLSPFSLSSLSSISDDSFSVTSEKQYEEYSDYEISIDNSEMEIILSRFEPLVNDDIEKFESEMVTILNRFESLVDDNGVRYDAEINIEEFAKIPAVSEKLIQELFSETGKIDNLLVEIKNTVELPMPVQNKFDIGASLHNMFGSGEVWEFIGTYSNIVARSLATDLAVSQITKPARGYIAYASKFAIIFTDHAIKCYVPPKHVKEAKMISDSMIHIAAYYVNMNMHQVAKTGFNNIMGEVTQFMGNVVEFMGDEHDTPPDEIWY